MRRAPGLLLLAALALLGTGCRRDEPSPDNDRTLARLKEEADRQASQAADLPPAGSRVLGPKGKPLPQQVDDALAQLAASQADKSKPPEPPGQKLALPEENATVHVGTVAVKLLSLSDSHSASGAKLTLSTEDLFLRAELVAQNVGAKPSKLDLAFARVTDAKGGEHPLARDVQRLAGTKELSAQLPPGERREFILYFEVPREGPGKGWSLTLPAAVGGEQDVAIPLG